MSKKTAENKFSGAFVESQVGFNLRNQIPEVCKELEKFETSFNKIKLKYIQEPGRMVNKINLCTDLISLNDQLREIIRYFSDKMYVSGTIPQPNGRKIKND